MNHKALQTLLRLAEAHEKNLKSDDPAEVESSIQRWGEMCDYLKSSPRTFLFGVRLEQFGCEAASALRVKETVQ